MRGLIIAGIVGVCGCTTHFPLSLIDATTDGAIDSGPDDPDGRPDVQPDVAQPGCGDGRLDTGEDCDDGNLADDDGCSATCEVEPGWTCTGEPSQCETDCGDGLVVGAETCDDGNQVDGDGCSAACQVECANGSVTDCNPPGETVNPSAAFVDPDPPPDFAQCAGFINTSANDVGAHWDGNCLGAVNTLRLRYWDTTQTPWVLLGDATLIPDITADFDTQVFSATNAPGTDGFLEVDGVTFLKDDPAGTSISTFICNPNHPNYEFGASDLYFADQADQNFFLVSGWSTTEDSDAPMSDSDEISRYNARYEQCINEYPAATEFAIAIYHPR